MTSRTGPFTLAITTEPGIPPEQKTLAQLEAERGWWEAKLENATQWGASVGFAAECRDGLNREIERRQKENKP